MGKVAYLLVFTSLCSVLAQTTNYYSSYYGLKLTKTDVDQYTSNGTLEVCTVNIQPCDPEEWRRLDGSCNNLKYPSVGTHRTPTNRLLPPILNPNYEPANTVNGEPFPLARRVRCELLSEGKASDLRTTQLLSYYLLFESADITSLNDFYNYIVEKLYCCKPEGKDDYMCTPEKIPVDDPVHRYSGVNCMNVTRPESYQNQGCLENGTTFVRMPTSTPVHDLSHIYKFMPDTEDLRVYEKGLIIIEEDDGKLFPPSFTTDMGTGTCLLNEPPRETRCNRAHANTAVGPVFLAFLFYRNHNHIANELHKLNPCWDDDRLYYTAREINIAMSLQIYYYELLPIVLGKENMIRDGIISNSDGFRDLYEENVLPQMFDEFPYVLRWFHTIQETDLKMYDNDGFHLNTIPMVNVSLRTGFLRIDKNLEKITQGSFRQYGGAFDFLIDFDMAERVIGGVHFASDVSMVDLNKGRYFGFQPYVNYRKFCTNRSYKTFEDLKDAMSTERIYRLKQIYKDVKDVELMSGLWVEKHVAGGLVPHTMYCLCADQLKRSIISDRHWYERSNRPHAFTLAQLRAIRHVTVAGLLCTVGDSVTNIQPAAFESISNRNRLTKCSSSKIGKLDLSAWKDPECNNKSHCTIKF